MRLRVKADEFKSATSMHQNQNQTQYSDHVPVLLQEVLDCLSPKPGDSYLDLTAGYAGHANAIAHITHGELTLVDRDENAIHELTTKLPEADIRHTDFLSASQDLLAAEKKFDMILADLGVSSPHLNEANRGFAINQDGPLDMRMDGRQELTAETIVNTFSETEIADILWRYGEEPKARQIARLITKHKPFSSTQELAAVVAKAWPGHSRVHPATRTFQALRIAVNDEIQLLEKSLPIWIDLLKPDGRLAVISFHSLEDKLVKQAFIAAGGDRYDARLRLLTKRPIIASPSELVFNPRARSAKLRAAVKINI